jgi:hypothetical protein
MKKSIKKEYRIENGNYDNVGITLSYETPLKHHNMPKGYYLMATCFNRTKTKDKYSGLSFATDEFALYDDQHITWRLVESAERFNRKKLEKIADKTIYDLVEINDFIKRNGRKYQATAEDLKVITTEDF